MAIADRRRERRRGPAIARRHHIGVTDKQQGRPIRTVHRVQVIDLTKAQMFDGKAFEQIGDAPLTTGVQRRHGLALQQIKGQ